MGKVWSGDLAFACMSERPHEGMLGRVSWMLRALLFVVPLLDLGFIFFNHFDFGNPAQIWCVGGVLREHSKICTFI